MVPDKDCGKGLIVKKPLNTDSFGLVAKKHAHFLTPSISILK